MSVQRLGFWALVAALLVDYGQVHRMVPLVSHLKPGLLTQALLLACVLAELPGMRWFRSIAVWRFLFLCAIASGLLLGITQGAVRWAVVTEFPRYLTIFLGVCLFLRRVSDLRAFYNLFLVMALLIALWVITHGGKGPGLFRDENDAALVLVMFLPFAFLRIFYEESARVKAASLAVFFVSLLAIGLTLSRGGLVGAIPALVFCWLKSRNKLIGVGLGAAAVAGAVAMAPDALREEFLSIADTRGGTAGARRYLWDLSVQLFMERPLFGVGALSWGNALYSGIIELPQYRAHMTPHSIYFQLLAELGLVGTFLWMGWLSATALGLRSLRADRLNAEAGLVLASDPDPRSLGRLRKDMLFMRSFVPALAIGIVGYLVCGAFLSVLYYPGLPLFAALVQASREAWRNELILAAAAARDASRGEAAGADGDVQGTDEAIPRATMRGGSLPGGAFRP